MKLEKIILGGGCFWCLEAAYQQVRGVQKVQSGYAGGHLENPTYKAVCTGETGHAEVVEVAFDADVISCRDILNIFFGIHDPTTKNRQGNDIGPQYRSVIFYYTEEQAAVAREVMAEVEKETFFPVVTELLPAPVFYPAEFFHDNFYRDNPEQGYCIAVIEPKLAKFRKAFAGFVK